MMDKHKLDERQLMIRGDIFMHGYFIIGALLILYAFILDAGLFEIEGVFSNIVILGISGTICVIEKIYRDVVDTSNIRMMILIIMLGVIGITSMVNGIMSAVSNGEILMSASMLSQTGSIILISVCEILIVLVYVVKILVSRGKVEDV